MNKRQAKKRATLIQLGMDWGFFEIPTYREIREMERGYHNFCVNAYRKEREIENIFESRIFD